MINCTFDLKDSGGNELFTKLFISPAIAPIGYSSSIVSNDSVIVLEKGAAITASLIPNTYNVRAIGFNTETNFLITLPTAIDNQTVNAKDYIVTVIPSASFAAATAISSSYALTASYALNGGGGGSGSNVSASYAVSASNATVAGGLFNTVGIEIISAAGMDFNSDTDINIVSADGNIILDSHTVQITNESGSMAVSVNGQPAIDSNGHSYTALNLNNSNIDLVNKQLNSFSIIEGEQYISVDWSNSTLIDEFEAVSLDWHNKIMYDNWTVNGTATTASYNLSSSHALACDTSISASRALTSSYALTAPASVSASYALSASYAPSSPSVSASYALSASYAPFPATSSYALTAISASYIILAQSASYNASSSHALNADLAVSASNVNTSSWALNSISSSRALTSSYALTVTTASNANSASWALNAITSSYITTAQTASYNASSSHALNSDNAITASYIAPIVTQFVTVATSSAQWITASFANAEQMVNITSGQAYTFTASNLPTSINVVATSMYINNTGVASSSLTFPSVWNFIGTAPASLAPSKVAILSLKAYGTSSIVAGFAVQN